jgi:hypothetical protein
MRPLVLLALLAAPAAFGQSFTLDAGVLGVTVRPIPSTKVAPLRPNEKPAGAMPAHAAATLAGGAVREGRIDVVDVEAWKALFANAGDAKRACVTSPVAGLAMCMDAPLCSVSTDCLAGCPDAYAPFLMWARPVKFQNGTGWLYVATWLAGPVSPSNEALEIGYQGLTDDRRTWVGLSIRASVDGFTQRRGTVERDPQKQRRREEAAVELLRKLGEEAVKPSLADVAAVLRTLRVGGAARPN